MVVSNYFTWSNADHSFADYPIQKDTVTAVLALVSITVEPRSNWLTRWAFLVATGLSVVVALQLDTA